MNISNYAYINACNLAAWQGAWPWARLDRLRDSVCAIVRCVALMKRIFSHPVTALAAGLGLRFFFVHKYPMVSADTVLYEQIAGNWLEHHVFAMTVDGRIVPVDLRMPGYPAFLAIVYAITGRTGPDARLWVMIAQALVDLLSCVLIATLAATLFLMVNERNSPGRVFTAALWLAALCPFTANYAAVPLTEVFATFFTVAALLPLCLLVGRTRNNGWMFIKKEWRLANNYGYLAALAALLAGFGTLFRP